ncbi:hypothetical protein L9F63_010433, partial [Diploptera punctata]
AGIQEPSSLGHAISIFSFFLLNSNMISVFLHHARFGEDSILLAGNQAFQTDC